ncbi:asparagine synthase (glutamine-hydrolyzing) [Micromonospora sp. NPDC003197]
MCGIAGLLSYRGLDDAARVIVAEMTDEHRLRGPDDRGVWFSPHAALGVRRLSVIDLAGGTQPMVHQRSGEEPVALAYTGEIFNYQELRAELAGRGHQFDTASDTEVVLRAYLEWGVECAERLLGMFAFAVWDGRTETLTLIRDRFGIYPLCWAHTEDGAVFGSEIKALLRHPGMTPEVDLDGLRAIVTMAKAPDHGIFRGVKEVEPGTIVQFRRSGHSVRRYWVLPAREHVDDLDTTVATVRELLTDSVRRQVVSDVPIGMFLSGGLDSSALAALATVVLRERGDEKLRTFSVDYVGHADAFDPDEARTTPDYPFVEVMARHLGTMHTRVELSTQQLTDPAVRAAVLRARDIPTLMGDLDTSLYLLCRAARQECTVSLMGDAADEIFGGYPWYHDPRFARPGTLPFLEFARQISAKLQARTTGLLAPELSRSLEAEEYERELYRAALAKMPVLDGEPEIDRRMREMSYLDITGYLRTVVLDRKDRIGMAASLEGRVPFLDHRLVEYVYNTPWAMKSFDGREKSLLRAAVRDLLPPSVLYRRKAGYPPTDDPRYDAWLDVRLGELIRDESAPIRPIMDVATARSYLADPSGAAGRLVNRFTKEIMLSLNDWLAGYQVRLVL